MKHLVNPLRWFFFKKLQSKKLQVLDLLIYSDAVITLSPMEYEEKSVVSTLIAALKEPELRSDAIIALGNIGVAAEASVGSIPFLQKH
jgi:hypothetical protein